MSLPFPTRQTWVCPRSLEVTVCQKCGANVPHRVEALNWSAPVCELHGVQMVRAPEATPIDRPDPEPATDEPVHVPADEQDDADSANRRRLSQSRRDGAGKPRDAVAVTEPVQMRHLSPVPTIDREWEDDDDGYTHRPHAKAVADAARRRGFDR
jgi:hypothetical protein